MAPQDFMQAAVAAARTGIAAGQSPFGAVVVRGSEVVASGHNEVWRRSDPTAHAEVVCIQHAAAALRSIDLSGCVMYTTCEPCPMCAAAIHWARLDAVVYGASIADAAAAGFNELTLACAALYQQGGSAVRVEQLPDNQACRQLFADFARAGTQTY